MPYIEFSNPGYIQRSNILPKSNPFNMKSLFSDNSFVCYKSGTYTVCAGTVRNRRTSSRRT